jgi:hypothetical protein
MKKLTLAQMEAQIIAWSGRGIRKNQLRQGITYQAFTNESSVMATSFSRSDCIREGYSEMQRHIRYAQVQSIKLVMNVKAVS